MIIPRHLVHGDVDIAVHHFTPRADSSSPVLVMCHPTGFCAGIYASVVAHLRNVNVYGIDMRCHGYSGRGDVTHWSGFARDLNAACTYIKHDSGHSQFFGIGISSGSSAHILHAREHSEDYRGLVLCEPIMFPPGVDLSAREMLAESARNRRDHFESTEHAFERFRTRGALSHLSDSALALYCMHGFTHDKGGITLACNKHDEEAIYLSGTANGVFDALSDIEVPANIIYGEHSPTMTAETAQVVAERMVHARVTQLDGVGHFTLFENPLRGAQLIDSFISELI